MSDPLFGINAFVTRITNSGATDAQATSTPAPGADLMAHAHAMMLKTQQAISTLAIAEQCLAALVVAIFGAGLIAILTRRPIWRCAQSGIYLALVPFVNWSFLWAPMFPIGHTGGVFTPLTIVTGLVLVVRDFAQAEAGKWILALLLIGVGLTYLSSGGALALASGAAFLVSELVDWSVYTFIKRPLSERVVISSAISAPVDSSVFLFLAIPIVPGIFNIWTVLASVFGKLLGATIVSLVIRQREKRPLKVSAK